MGVCFVPGCQSGSGKEKNSHLMKISKKASPDIQVQWLRNIPGQKFRKFNLATDTLCYKHFEDKYVRKSIKVMMGDQVMAEQQERKRWTLTEDAVPTIFCRDTIQKYHDYRDRKDSRRGASKKRSSVVTAKSQLKPETEHGFTKELEREENTSQEDVEEFQSLTDLDVKIEIKEEVTEEFKKSEIPNGEADEEHLFVPTSSSDSVLKEIETVPISLRLTQGANDSTGSVEKIDDTVSRRKPTLPGTKNHAHSTQRKKPNDYLFGRVAKNLLCRKCVRSRKGICPKHANSNLPVGIYRIGPEPFVLGFLKCKLCPRHFANKYYLDRHVARAHNGYKCDVCSADFLLASALENHKKLKHVEWKFKCEKCNHEFRGKADVLNHRYECAAEEEQIATGSQTASIPIEESADLEQVPILEPRSGSKARQEELISDSPRTDAGDKECVKIRRYKCTHCPRSFRNSGNLHRHIDAYKGIKFPCKFCGYNFTNAHSRKVHQQRSCPKLVSKTSSHDDGPSVHSADISSGNLVERSSGSTTCSLCHMKCASSISLRNHIRFFHKPTPSATNTASSSEESKRDLSWKQVSYSFECHICHEKFHQSEQLRNHLPIAHGKDQPEIKYEVTQEFKEEYENGDIN